MKLTSIIILILFSLTLSGQEKSDQWETEVGISFSSKSFKPEHGNNESNYQAKTSSLIYIIDKKIWNKLYLGLNTSVIMLHEIMIFDDFTINKYQFGYQGGVFAKYSIPFSDINKFYAKMGINYSELHANPHNFNVKIQTYTPNIILGLNINLSSKFYLNAGLFLGQSFIKEVYQDMGNINYKRNKLSFESSLGYSF